jgi:hypothetical protein
MVMKGDALHLPEDQPGVVGTIESLLKRLYQAHNTEGGVVSHRKKARNLLDVVSIHGALHSGQGHGDQTITNVC